MQRAVAPVCGFPAVCAVALLAEVLSPICCLASLDFYQTDRFSGLNSLSAVCMRDFVKGEDYFLNLKHFLALMLLR